MTDNEKLARWQEWEEYHSDINKHVPDYLNDDAAAMSLLDTLVEKGFYPELFYCIGHKWNCTISDDGDLVVQGRDDTRRAAVVAACLEVARKEMDV